MEERDVIDLSASTGSFATIKPFWDIYCVIYDFRKWVGYIQTFQLALFLRRSYRVLSRL